MDRSLSPAGDVDRLFLAKLSPPLPVPRPFRRRRLLRRLQGSWKRKLTIIAAPPGYGKTTLLQTWAAAQRQPQPFGWLRLDPDDNEPHRFLVYLIHAIPLLPDAFRKEWTRRIRETDLTLRRLESVAAQWIDMLNRDDRPFMLIADGFEAIDHPDILRFLELFLRFCPVRVHVVLSGRRISPFALPKPEDGGSEVWAFEDLALTDKELQQYAFQQTAVKLNEMELQNWQHRSQGWFVGVNACLPSIRSREMPDAGPDDESEAERTVGDYFRSLLRADVRPALANTLMRLAVPRSFTRELIRPLLESAGLEAAAIQLPWPEWFLLPCREQAGQYAFHPLFSSFLRRELAAADAKMYAALHRLCAERLEAEGRYVEAAELALDGGDRKLAVEKILLHTPVLLRQGNLLSLLERFTESELRQHPELGYLYGYSLLHARRVQAADRVARLLAAEEEESGGTMLLSTGEPLGGYLASLRSAIHFSRGEADLGLHHMQLAEKQLSGPGRLHRSALYLSPAGASILAGKYGHYGMLQSAIATYEYCLPRWKQQDLAFAVITVGLGECRYEEGKLEQAESCLRQGLQLSLDLNEPGVFVPAFLAWARLLHSRGETELAWAALREARRQLRLRRLEDRLAVVDACEVKLRVREHDTKQVKGWLRDLAFPATHSPERMFESTALLRAYAFTGRTTEALELGASLHQMALAANHPRDLIEINLQLALIHRKQGKAEQALEKLICALTEAHAHGYVQTFVDEGAALADLLKRYGSRARTNNKPELAKFAGALLRAIPKDIASENAANAPLADSLTLQEKRVFHLLLQGASNRTIADALSISVETVKKHCRHIYEKLGVSNRKQAAQLRSQAGSLCSPV